MEDSNVPSRASDTRRVYTRELLVDACKNSDSVSGVLRYLGLKPSGGNHSHISRRIKEYGLEFSVYAGKNHAKGKESPWRKSANEILIQREPLERRTPAHQLRRALKEIGVAEECSSCGTGPEWNGAPLRLQVDHIDGNWSDSRPENIRYLCPNCHSQTETYGRTT